MIRDLSDTARLAAAYRAVESKRRDALFVDPYAAQFAGERGRALADGPSMPAPVRNGWPVIIATRLADDLILASIAAGCDRVINLAADWDARPYRLELPADLDWIEADRAAVISAKAKVLDTAAARCRLTRQAIEVDDAQEVTRFLAAATRGAHRALVITEGTLQYEEPERVRELSRNLQLPEIRWWITELVAPVALEAMLGRAEYFGTAMMRFAPIDGVRFLEAEGWRTADSHSILQAAMEWKRLSAPLRLLARLPDRSTAQEPKGRWSGVVRLEH